MDKDIIEKAKIYARSSGRSLSNLIESYLEVVTSTDAVGYKSTMPPKLKRLHGAVSIPANLDHKTEIRKILTKKNK